MKKYSLLASATVLLLLILFIITALWNVQFLNWLFERHKNAWSWYIRPLFLLPFCYFSLKRSSLGISVTLLCLFTSMAWFPRPQEVSQEVAGFLQFEKQWLTGDWPIQKIASTLLIPISLILLCMAFWERNYWFGINVIFVMAIGKVVWSVSNAGDLGKSILVPALAGLFICILCAVLHKVYINGKKLRR